MSRAACFRLVLWFATIGLLAAAPAFVGSGVLLRGVEIAYFIALAQMWNLLAGYAGIMSIGQQLFVGLGGYTLFSAVALFGLPIALALPLSGVVVALAAALSAPLLFRLRGPYFAIGSWVLAESVMLVISRVDSLGGASGLSLPVRAVREMAASAELRTQIMWWLALGFAVASTLIVYLWLRSRQGLALMALRDNEGAAAGLGVDTWRVKLLVFVVVATITGLIGGLIFLTKLRISPEAAFNIGDWTSTVLFIVVIGGIGCIEGPLLGALVYFALREILSDYGSWYLMVLGAIAIVTMLKMPHGLGGLISQRTGWQLFQGRAGLRS